MTADGDYIDILSGLNDRNNFEQVVFSFQKKARTRPSRLFSHPVVPEINLRWLLFESDFVINTLVRSLRQASYEPLPATTNKIKFDKWRNISSLSWPDRLVETVLARLVTQAVESQLSSRLFSFRKGFGNFKAVREFAAFVKQAEIERRPLYAARRDVQSYGDSISRSILFKKLRKLLGPQDPYVFTLLEAFLSAAARDDDQGLGVPTGLALTPTCENVYLADLDTRLAQLDDLFYVRFGDDILVASTSESVACDALRLIDEDLAALQLNVNVEKGQNVAFRAQSDVFKTLSKIEYLGLSIKEDGAIFLSDKKKRVFQGELRRVCRQGFLSLRRLKRPRRECVQHLVGCLQNCFDEELRHPYFSYLLSTIDDESELKKLDTWIARLPLSQVYGNTHDRVFRYCSRKQLHEMGIPSIQRIRIAALRARHG